MERTVGQSEHPPTTALLRALADALLADGDTPAQIADAVHGQATPGADGYSITAHGLPLASLRLRLGDSGLASLALTPAPDAPLGVAALEAAFGPGRDGGPPMPVERVGAFPAVVGVRFFMDYDYTDAEGRRATVDAVLDHAPTSPQAQALEVTILRPKSAASESSKKRSLFGWLRR